MTLLIYYQVVLGYKFGGLWCKLRKTVATFLTNGINYLLLLIFLQLLLQASGTNSFGVIVGGSNLEQRKLCATEVSKRNVSGYFYISFDI